MVAYATLLLGSNDLYTKPSQICISQIQIDKSVNQSRVYQVPKIITNNIWVKAANTIELWFNKMAAIQQFLRPKKKWFFKEKKKWGQNFRNLL